MKKDRLQQRDRETLEALLGRLEIAAWDFLIVGDGSGSDWKRGAGWASISIERATMERRAWYGAVNFGTVNFAEIMAYLQPLNWLAAREEGKHRAVRVHIVTDSMYCKNKGHSRNGAAPGKNAGLWTILDAYTRQGLVTYWHHADREDVMLNRFVDRLSRAARLALARHDLVDHVEGQFGVAVEDCNPAAG